MNQHTKTDPACIHYKETGLFRHYLNERGRGKNCPECVPPALPTDTVIGHLVNMAENRESLLKNGLPDRDEWIRADVEAKSYRTAVALIRRAAK